MYTIEQARTDFARLALANGLTDDTVQAVLDEITAAPAHGFPLLADLLREANDLSDEEFSDALLDREGFLWTLVFADLDGGDVDGVYEYLGEEGKAIVDAGDVLATADADSWILKDGDVFRVHMEGVTKLGAYAEYMNKQVELAIG